MTNQRFWKIVDKYERTTDHITGIESSITDLDSAIKEIVYYDRGLKYQSEADLGLLLKGYPNKEQQAIINVVCDEYNNLGMKGFRKKYKEILSN